MLDLSEFQTRKQKIDVFLKKSGCNVEGKKKVLPMVKSKRTKRWVHEQF